MVRTGTGSHHFAVTLLARMPEELKILALLFRSADQWDLADAAHLTGPLPTAAAVEATGVRA